MFTKTECSYCALKSRAVESLTDEELKLMTNNCAEVRCKPGENIIKEGTLSSHIAYLKCGLAKVHMIGPGDVDQILKIVSQGSYIGIQTILTDKIHRYSATALKESIVCYIDINLFKELIQRNSQFAFELILYLCADELSYFERFVNLSQKNVNGRLADTLLYFSKTISKSENFELPLSRNDLAALIGVRRESIARSMKDLSDTDIIAVDGRKIQILNEGLLEKISNKG
ncbi:MAG: Crp/Fnr family transcriptional regulator [Bacteroidales bacterium]|nr:Crp/Fnr family transcriptional regulator [Bacteroidales bacterium]